MASSSSTILAAEAELQQGFETLKVLQKHPSVPIFHLLLNRPSRRNSLSSPFFSDLPRALSLLSLLPSARALVLSSIGPHFSSGIDLTLLSSLPSSPPLLRSRILALQSSLSALERFPMPVIAAVRGACIGAGVDLVAACDIRLCSEDAFFVVKEVDLALAADLGSLQRLPRIIGYGNAVELALTGRRLSASEAKAMGLVSRVFDSPSKLEEAADCLARELAEKSSVAVMGTKAVLLKSRDQKVDEGLDYVATWNSAMLMSPDLEEAVAAQLQKRKPNFSKL